MKSRAQDIAYHGRERPVVVDFTTAWSGPLCGAVLADFGWDVIKVETSRRPDVTRRLGPFADGVRGIERSGYFDTLNRGKRSIAVDLSTEQGRSIAFDLCVTADVVVENFSPGVMAKLGLDYERLSASNPGLVMASISGYGQSGPESRYVAYGQTIEAVSGVDAMTGYAAGPPMACGAPVADPIAGLTAALHILAAHHHRRLTGHGAHLDVSMLESLVAMLPYELLDYQLNGRIAGPRGNEDGIMAPHGVYPCRGENRWLAVAVQNDAQWTALCETVGRHDWSAEARFADRYRRHEHRAALDELLAKETACHDARDLADRLQQAGVPATEVLDGNGLQSDPALAARSFYVPVQTTEAGERRIPGALTSFSATPLRFQAAGPRLGAHTAGVLQDLLGMDDEQIRELTDAGILA